MSVVNKKFGFVFLAEPYTGSRAVREALCKLEGSVETNGNHHLDLLGCVAQGFLSYLEAETFTVFSTIRDPHDLLVSCWICHNYQCTPFQDYLKIACQSEQQNNAGRMMDTLFWRTCEWVDWFIRHETLLAGLNTILDQIGAPLVEEFPIIGRTQEKPDWRQLWNEDLEKWGRVFFPDILRYDYRANWEGLRLIAANIGQRILTKPNHRGRNYEFTSID